MALSVLNTHFNHEDSEFEDLLGLSTFGEDYENSLRPSIADKLHIGFLASDQCTQTHTTEILDIKELNETVHGLVEDMGVLKHDLQFNKHVIKATFEEKLENKAFELHSKLNARLRDIHDIHEERVGVVRRSFKQQLQDTLVKMAAHYKKYYEEKLEGKLPSAELSSGKKKIAALEAELLRNQSMMEFMENQIETLKSDLHARSIEPSEMIADATEVDQLQKENSVLKGEIATLNDKIDELSMSLEFRDEKVNQLNAELVESKTEFAKVTDMSRKLAHQVDGLRRQVGDEQMSAAKKLEEQKLTMERDAASKLAENQTELHNSAKERQKMMERMDVELERRVADERKKFELQLAQLKDEAKRNQRDQESTKSLQRLIEQQRNEILTYQQRLLKSQKLWERKFAILKASLHAIKDESYIRMQLQKQAATLRYASISYGSEGPNRPQNYSPKVGPGSTPPRQYFPATKPLPSINKVIMPSAKAPTNTLPSGVGTEPFSGDEEYLEDEFDEDFIPLPPKPPNFGEYMPAIA